MFDVINNIVFQIHGGGHHSDGVSSGMENFLVFIEKLFSMQPVEIFAAILPGLNALVNVHPMFVHFPIALFSAFLFVELLAMMTKKEDWHHVASWFLYLGTLAAVVTVIAGVLAANSVDHGENVHDIMERHKQMGMAVLSLSIALSAWRLKSAGIIKSGVKWIYLFLTFALFILVFLTADLGGLMVYKFGVAVKAVPVIDTSHVHSGHVHSH